MLKILSLEFRGFLNGPIESPVTVPFDAKGLTLVLGDNGKGKSTRYVESLVWGLYGKTLRDLSADGVINVGSDGAYVTVRLFDDDTEDTVVVERTKVRGKAQALSVYAEGPEAPREMFPASSVSERQEYFERWLGLDFNTFVNSVVFGQGAAALFASGLSDAERKAVFDRVCGLDEYDSAFAIARENRKIAEGKVSSPEASLLEARARVAHLNTEIDAARERERQLSVQIDDARENLAKEIETAELELQDAKKSVASARKLLTEAEEELSASSATDATELKTTVEAIRTKLRAQRNLLFQHKSTISRAEASLVSLESRAGQLEQSKTLSLCPYCGGVMADLSKIEGDIAECETQMASELAVVDSLEPVCEQLAGEVDALELELREKDAELVGLDGRRRRAVEAVASRRAVVKATAEVAASKEKALAGLGAGVAALEGRLEEVRTVLVSRCEALAAKSSEIEQLERMVQEASVALEVARFWEEAFGPRGIKAFVIEGMLPTLNQLANEHLSKLSDGGLSVEVSATTALKKGGVAEKLSVNVKNSRGAEVYAGNSGGERRRIDLAILLALQDLVGSRASRAIDLCVYDEILDALDDDGISRAVTYLKERSVNRPTYLISHSDATKTLVFDEILKVA